MQNALRWPGIALLLGAITVMLGGCKTVDTVHPIGDAVAEDLSEKLDGTWYVRDAVVMLKWHGDGRLQIAVLAEQDGELQTMKIDGLLTHVGDRYFLHLRPIDNETGKPKDGPMGFSALTITDDALVVMNPIPLAFARAVDQGELAGTVDKKHDAGGKITAVNTHLTADSQALANYIATRDGVGPFDWQSPMVLVRFQKPDRSE